MVEQVLLSESFFSNALCGVELPVNTKSYFNLDLCINTVFT